MDQRCRRRGRKPDRRRGLQRRGESRSGPLDTGFGDARRLDGRPANSDIRAGGYADIRAAAYARPQLR